METIPHQDRSLNRVIDSITDPLVIYDRGYRIVMVNQAMMTIYQRNLEQLIGGLCYKVFHGRGSPCEECHVREVFRTGEPQIREKIIRLPDGQLRQFEIRAYPVKDADGTIVQAIEHGRDISERKNLENQVKTSEERYQTIVEIAREGIFIADGEAKVTFANKRLAGMLGYGPEEPQRVGGRLRTELQEQGWNVSRRSGIGLAAHGQ
jgi:PAS domain S-box-containing protein